MADLRLLCLLASLPLLLSGCTSDAPGPAADPVVDEAPATLPVPVTVSQDGTLALGNCSDTGNACVLNVGDPTKPYLAGNIVHVPILAAQGGDFVGGSGTLTWTANSPLTTELVLRVSLLHDCPDHCGTDQILAETQGPSPLTIEIPAVAVGGDLTLGFTVVRAEFMDSGQRMSLLQDFHVDGSAQPAA